MSSKTVIKKLIPKSIFGRIEPFGHLVEAIILHALAGFPARGIKVIGVTGTNGKTTTTLLIHSMLHSAGIKTGMMSTVSYGIGDDIRPQMHHMTNVSVPELIKRLKWMKSQNIEWLVLETTSHALAQNRVWGIPYSISVLTNITHEHLAYHGTFERYLNAKKHMFTLTNRNKNGYKVGIINRDDPNADKFAAEIDNPMFYGLKNADLIAKDIKISTKNVSYSAESKDEKYDINCHLGGSFNVHNSLAVVAVGKVLGLSKAQIESGVASLKSVEGRMTQIDEGQEFDVIVDYAHTPDSFDKLFADIRPNVKGKIITVFGSLGGGDKNKRPVQGEIAGKYSDIVVLTQEDDRQEDPLQILDDISRGAINSGKIIGTDLFLIHDRKKAIKFAFENASNDDMVLLLGKGHEKTQEDASGEHPWNEIEIAKQLLNKQS